MAVRELVENSLDAAEGAGTLPEVYVRIIGEGAPDLPDPKPYRLTVIDNGPGVAPQHVPSAFGKVFYGSKYVLRQSRGMFGLGGTMAILYGQVTTNRPVVVTVSDGKRRHSYQMMIDIGENRPMVLKHNVSEANGTTGTRVDLTLEGDYPRASQKIGDYFKQTALVASYVNLTFVDPTGLVAFYERATTSMPPAPKETLPHPHGIDVEAFKRMVKMTDEKTMERFMGNKHFHRVGDTIANNFLRFAGVSPKLSPKRLNNNQVVAMVDALQRFPDFLQPDAAVLSPVGEEILLAGMKKELQPEFATVVTRPPSSYSGFPFLVEVGMAYGGRVLQPGQKLFRFANRIPLLYDESSDVSFVVLNQEVDWRRYHVPPDAPVAVLTHVASTRIPYKTVGKEYIADRPEIQREIRNAVREALRRLSIFLSRKGTAEAVQRKMNIYGKYLPLIAQFSQELAGKKRPPDYSKLMGEAEVQEEAERPDQGAAEGVPDVDVQAGSGDEDEQKTIDQYGGS